VALASEPYDVQCPLSIPFYHGSVVTLPDVSGRHESVVGLYDDDLVLRRSDTGGSISSRRILFSWLFIHGVGYMQNLRLQ